MAHTETRLGRDVHIGKGRHLSIDKRYAKEFPLHAHDYFEVEIVLDGRATQRINGTEMVLERGGVSILSPSDFHEIHLEPNGELQAWNVAFDETVLSSARLSALFARGGTYRVLDEATLCRVDTAAGLLEQELDHEDRVRPLLEYVLSLLMGQPVFPEELTPMRRAILYVDTHFRENPSLGDVAKVACLSPVYFGNVFKQTTGETFVNYLNARKVQCAEMLLESGLSVADTCFSAGFGSLSGFLHAFKQHTGMSPDSYKRMKR